MELSTYIAELLYKHDCVVVPNFGGFIANYRSAVIEKSQNRILPPSKDILFNPKLINNDGLLGNHIAEVENFTYANALNFIADQVENWQSTLADGNRIEIDEIGFLFKQNGQVKFEQSREVNLLLQAYGLSSVKFVGFKEESIKPKEQVVQAVAIDQIKTEKEEAVIALPQVGGGRPESQKQQRESVSFAKEAEVAQNQKPHKRKNRGALKYLAAAATVPFLFYAYWIPMQTDFMDTGKIQLADFNPVKSAPERTYQMRFDDFEWNNESLVETWAELTGNLSENVKVYNYHFDDELYIPVRLDKTAVASKNIPVTQTSDSKKFHLIAGCFSVKENAETLVSDLKKMGYSAYIFDQKGGLFRVTAGDYEDRTAANLAMEKFKSKGSSGWILKK